MLPKLPLQGHFWLPSVSSYSAWQLFHLALRISCGFIDSHALQSLPLRRGVHHSTDLAPKNEFPGCRGRQLFMMIIIIAEHWSSCPDSRSHPRAGASATAPWILHNLMVRVKSIKLDVRSQLCLYHVWGAETEAGNCAKVGFTYTSPFNPCYKSKRETLLLPFLWMCKLRQRVVKYNTSKAQYHL